MNKLLVLSAAVAAVALAGANAPASATVAPSAASETVVATLDGPPVVKAPSGEIKLAHGWHRSCRRYNGAWHYHSGYNTWYPCPAPAPRPYSGGGGGGGY